MNNINKHNYEAFLLDYLEGTLDTGLEKELMAFLELHPEIELEDFNVNMVTLESPEIKLQNKESIKKAEDSNELNEIDLLIIGEIEGINDAVKTNLLETEKISNPEISKVVNLYKKTILTAPSIIFANKNKIKRRAAIPFRPIFAIAASLLLLCLFYIGFKPNKEIVNGTIVAVNDSNKEIININPIVSPEDTILVKNIKPEDIPSKKAKERLVKYASHKGQIKLTVDSALKQKPNENNIHPEQKENKSILVKNEDPVKEKNKFDNPQIQEEEWISAASMAFIPPSNTKKDKTIDINKLPKQIIKIVNNNLFNEEQKSDQLLVHSFTRGKFSITKTSTL